MKTTSGKVRVSRRPARVVQIFGDRDRLLAVRRASSLAQALREYAKDQQLEDPKVIGNVLTVTTKFGTKQYTAKEA